MEFTDYFNQMLTLQLHKKHDKGVLFDPNGWKERFEIRIKSKIVKTARNIF
jgi:predicted secreted protein